MKNMLKDAVILFIITLISGSLLGFVYQVTKQPIAEQKAKAQNEACKEVFKDAVDFQEIQDQASISEEKLSELGITGVSIDKVLVALDDLGNQLGVVLSVVSHSGYNGDIGFYMGIGMDGTLNGISILSISETPGLGMKAESVLKPQFANKKAEQFEYTKRTPMSDNEISAISGATITTEAMTNGVNAGMTYFTNVYKNSLEGGTSK